MSGTESPRGWHADEESLRAWADGRAGPALGASVEQHLLRCVDCRAAVGTHVATPTLDHTWDRVLEQIEVPRVGLLERTLLRLGVGPRDSLLVAAAPSARLSWLTGVAAVLLFAAVSAAVAEDGGVALFLMVAPIVPVGAVATAYGRTADPSYEVVLAAPYSTLRLVLLRTAAVLVPSVPLAVLVGLLLPGPSLLSVAWLLPAAALVATVLTVSAWVDPVLAGTAAVAAWVVAVAVATQTGDPLSVIDAAALVSYTAALVVGCVVLLGRLKRTPSGWPLG